MQPSTEPVETALPELTANSVTLRGDWIARLTLAEFESFCLQSAHKRHRIERPFPDCLLVSPQQGMQASQLNGAVSGQLMAWERISRLGCCVGATLNFCLPAGPVLSPDAAWLTTVQRQGLSVTGREGFPHLAPAFVTEIASWGESRPWLREKMEVWRTNGVRLGWLIIPETETVHIYREGRDDYEAVQGFDQDLSGEPVLPGFALDLRELRALLS